MPSTTGDVEIAIIDGGAGIVTVPANSVQLVIGPSFSGDLNTIVATRSPDTLKSIFGGGPLPEAAALAILSGGTVLAMRAETIEESNVGTTNMTRVATSTCVVTISGTPYDELYVKMLVTTGGTVGPASLIKFRLSLDAGRTFGPTISLGASSSFDIPDTGLSIAFGSGTLDKGDYALLGTTHPLTDTGSVAACLNVFKASQYAVSGIGSIHIVTPFDGSDQDTIGESMDGLTDRFIYNRALTELPDASPPVVWSGTGDSESDWMDAVLLDTSAVDAKRICQSAGAYNMPSAFRTALSGTPRYRRNLAWALAARQVAIPPQRHAGRVRDGSLNTIVIDPTNDPSDGFVYHDESLSPGFDVARITSARLRIGLPGFYIVNPLLASPPGSVFTLLPLGNVMDVACGIVHQVGQQEINDDIRLNNNGTIYENEAQRIEHTLFGAIKVNMIDKNELSDAKVSVDRTNNIRATNTVNLSVVIYSRGYILEEDVNISFASAFEV